MYYITHNTVYYLLLLQKIYNTERVTGFCIAEVRLRSKAMVDGCILIFRFWIICSTGLTSNKRVDRNLLDDAFFFLLSQLEIHGCSYHQVTLQKKNTLQTHFGVISGDAWSWRVLFVWIRSRWGYSLLAIIQHPCHFTLQSEVCEPYRCCLEWRDILGGLWLVPVSQFCTW